MTFAESINALCKHRGTTLTAVCKSLNLSNAKVTAINRGSIPSEDQLIAMAKRLDVSVADLFDSDRVIFPIANTTHTDDENTLVVHTDTPESVQDIGDFVSLYQSCQRMERHKLMSMIYEFEEKK